MAIGQKICFQLSADPKDGLIVQLRGHVRELKAGKFKAFSLT